MSSRKNKSSILSIIIGFFLVILAFVSFGLSAYFGYKNYFKGANYDSSINIRYELDPYTVEDPTAHKQTYIDEKDLRDKLNKLADSYSQSLLDKNKTNSNVTTELY
jgi:flagellar basal body-associated protein FliL